MKHIIGDNQPGKCTAADALMLDGKVITKQQVVELIQRNAELVAMVERLRDAVRGVQSVPKRSGFAVNDPDLKAEMIAWMRLNEVMAATPQQCLRQIQADVLDAEADLILAAPADAQAAGNIWSESDQKIALKIGSMLKSRAALVRAKAGQHE